MLQQARASVAAGDAAGAIAVFRSSLLLWRGAPFTGLSAAHASEDPALIAAAYDGLADRHFQAKEHAKARDMWVAAAVAFREAGNELRWALSNDNIGMMELELGNPVAAERHHRETLESPALADKPRATISIHIHLGLVYGSTQRWPQCQAALEEAYTLAMDAANPELACFALYNLAEMFRQIGDLDSARARAQEVIELATRTQLPVRVARAHHLLFDLLASEDPETAENIGPPRSRYTNVWIILPQPS